MHSLYLPYPTTPHPQTWCRLDEAEGWVLGTPGTLTKAGRPLTSDPPWSCLPLLLPLLSPQGLKTPGGCELVVGGEPQCWAEGRCLLFDDSFLHTAFHEGECRPSPSPPFWFKLQTFFFRGVLGFQRNGAESAHHLHTQFPLSLTSCIRVVHLF